MEDNVLPENGEGLENGESMEGNGSERDAPDVGRAREKPKSSGRFQKPHRNGTHEPYPFEFRLKVVKLCVEEGLPFRQVYQEAGITDHTFSTWLRVYREGGEEALRAPFRRSSRSGRQQLPEQVKQQMVELKQAHPAFGVKRISQFLHRVLHLPGSAETVRRTLHGEGLIEPARRKPQRAPPKPRFFERTTPNQLWQSDIFTFRLAGKNAYLIGFIDDYSRYLVGLEVYRSQSADNVLEVYRRAVGEYGVPREMLTDNGRQYTSWRGVTKFEQEIKKDKVHHIRSRPHHPMTLGKIERFWKNIWGEFLCKAQFDSFESARERLRLWVSWYNHRRPHQGIGGLCPADRFFEIRNDLRQVIERNVKENALELALRGKPQRPFYLVGRLDQQSVVMQAVKGKLVMTVNDHTGNTSEEIICDLEKGKVNHEGPAEKNETAAAPVPGDGEVPGGAELMDGTAVGIGPVPGTGSELEPAQPVAGTGDGGDAAGSGAAAAGLERADLVEHAAAEPSRPENGPGEPAQSAAEHTGRTLDPDPAPAESVGPGKTGSESLSAVPQAVAIPPELIAQVLRMLADGVLNQYVNRSPTGLTTGAGPEAARPLQQEEPHGTAGSTGPGDHPAAGSHSGRDQRREIGHPGGGGAGSLPADVLRMAESGTDGPAGGDAGPTPGTSGPAALRPGKSPPGTREPRTPASGQDHGGCDPDPGPAAGSAALPRTGLAIGRTGPVAQ